MIRQDRIVCYLLLFIVSISAMTIPDSFNDDGETTDMIDSSTFLTEETTLWETDSISTKITPPLTLIPEPIEVTDELNTTVIILTTSTTAISFTTSTTAITRTTPNTTISTTSNVLNDAIGVYSSYFLLTISIVLLLI